VVRRIDVLRIAAGKSRGTGFLVAPDRALTALHVIGKVTAGRLVLHGEVVVEAAIATTEGLRLPVYTVPADAIAFDLALDCAYLRVEPSLFAEVAVLPIGDASRLAAEDTWRTYGFPNSAPADGMGAMGMITSTGAMLRVGSARQQVLQLYSLQAGAGHGGVVRGYSGAPVVVRGHAVAMLIAAPENDEGRSDEGTLYGVLLAAIAPKLGLTAYGALPLLPAEIGYPAAPFRGLHRYRRSDARLLFGRDREIQEILGALDRAPNGLVLVSGQTGVGKSSILEAGVLPRLESAFKVRLERVEHGDIHSAWTRATTGDWLAAEAVGQPIIVVLDQVEDAWVAGALDTWIRNNLALCFKGGRWLPCGRLILSFRKEWAAEIQSALNAHGVGHWYHVHVSPLAHSAIVDAVHGVEQIDRYHVSIEPGLGVRIAEALRADSDAPLAPTLQVWLTEMHDRQQGPIRRLTRENFERLVRDGASLGDFLDRQLQSIPSEARNSGLGLDILAFHVGPAANAASRSHSQRHSAYAADGIDVVIQGLEAAGLLVPLADRSGYRLIHDTLAPAVLSRAATSNWPAQRARSILDAHCPEWRRGPMVDDVRGHLAPLLDARLLEIVERARPAMRALENDEAAFVLASRTAANIAAANQERRNNPAGVYALLLDTDASSPSCDLLACAMEASKYVRPLGRINPNTVAISGDGNTLFFTIPTGELWIVRTENLSAKHSFTGIVDGTLEAASDDGAWCVICNEAGAYSFDVCTKTMQSLDFSSIPWDCTSFVKGYCVTNTGTVFVFTVGGVAAFTSGSARATWCRPSKQCWPGRLFGPTNRYPYFAGCVRDYLEDAEGQLSVVVWFDVNGNTHEYRVPGQAKVVDHRYIPDIAVLSRHRLYILNLATGEITRELDLREFSMSIKGTTLLRNESITNTDEDIYLVAKTDLGECIAIQRGRTILLNLNTAWHAPIELKSGERLRMMTATDNEVVFITSTRIIRISVGYSLSEELLMIPDWEHFEPRLVLNNGFALIINNDPWINILYSIEFSNRASPPIASKRLMFERDLRKSQVAISRTAIAGIIAADRPFLLSRDVRNSAATIERVAHANDVRMAYLDGETIATAGPDGSLVLHGDYPRYLGTTPLEADEEITKLARSDTSWFVLTNQHRVYCITPGDRVRSLKVSSFIDERTYTHSSLNCLATSPDSRWLLVGRHLGHQETPLQLFALKCEVDNSQPFIVHGEHSHTPYAFSHDSRWLAIATVKGIVIWELDCHPKIAHKIMWRRGEHVDFGSKVHPVVISMAFRADNHLVAIWSWSDIDIINSHTGEVTQTFRQDDWINAVLSPNALWCAVDGRNGIWLCPTADLPSRVRLSSRATFGGRNLIAIDDRARWLITRQGTRTSLSAIDPYGPRIDPIDLGTAEWCWLAPDGDVLITLTPQGQLVRRRLDGARLLHEQIVCG
jgi:hypothetical protein